MYTMHLKRLRVDYENNAVRWWDAAREPEAMALCPEGARPILGSEDEVDVDDATATAFLRWASELPGWDDGPEHAPHAVIVEDP